MTGPSYPWARRQREQTMAPSIEAGRNKRLKQIADDYGLEWNDQTRAGLIAAFHTGIEQHTNVIMAIKFGQPPPPDPDAWQLLVEDDRDVFRRAYTAKDQQDDKAGKFRRAAEDAAADPLTQILNNTN